MTKKNPYAGVELSEEQWDQILGPDVMTPLPRDEAHALFLKKLQFLKPYHAANSLHIQEHRYKLDDVKYCVLWAYHDTSPLPFEVSIITPRPRKVQLAATPKPQTITDDCAEKLAGQVVPELKADASLLGKFARTVIDHFVRHQKK